MSTEERNLSDFKIQADWEKPACQLGSCRPLAGGCSVLAWCFCYVFGI